MFFRMLVLEKILALLTLLSPFFLSDDRWIVIVPFLIWPFLGNKLVNINILKISAIDCIMKQ